MFFSASVDHTVRIWNASNGRELRTLRGHFSEVIGVTFSPDGKYIASSSNDQSVRLWDATTGRELRSIFSGSGGLYGVGFSPDGRYIVAGGSDKTAAIWNIDLRDPVTVGCSLLLRDLTPLERSQYGITDRGLTCKEFANLPQPLPEEN